jgi:hypothetical protein
MVLLILSMRDVKEENERSIFLKLVENIVIEPYRDENFNRIYYKNPTETDI